MRHLRRENSYVFVKNLLWELHIFSKTGLHFLAFNITERVAILPENDVDSHPVPFQEKLHR